jgi:hypothetical protein
MKVLPACLTIALVSFSALCAHADPAACRAELFAASQKSLVAPSHTYVSQVLGPKGLVSKSEMISVGNKSYDKLDSMNLGSMKLADDGWTVSRVSPQEMAKLMRDSYRDAEKDIKNYQCAHVRDETIDGVAAGVYVEHAETDNATSDTQTWISKSQGLIVKSTTKAGDSTMTISYVYTNVQAPSNARQPAQ